MDNNNNIKEISFGVQEFNFREGSMPVCAIAYDDEKNLCLVMSKTLMEASRIDETKEAAKEINDGLWEVFKELSEQLKPVGNTNMEKKA